MIDDTTGKTEAGVGEQAAIDFEKAEIDGAGGEHVECTVCKQAITTEYWQFAGKILCDACRAGVRMASGDAGRAATFGKALVLGGLAALGCGVGYAIFVGLTHFQFALVTIGMGWVVGRAVQRATRGFGSKKHQVLAVALTYFASSMGYFPAVLKALDTGASSASVPAASASAAAETPPGANLGAAPARSESPPSGGAQAAPPSVVGLVIGIVFLLVFTLAAPILDIMSGLSGAIGALIIFFGLQMAWRASKGIEGEVTGPHAIAGTGGA